MQLPSLAALQESCPWSPWPSCPMSATAPWWHQPRLTRPTTAKSLWASSCPGSTPSSGPCRHCLAGAATAPRVPAQPAQWTGRPRRPTTYPTSSACLSSAWSCRSWLSSSATGSCCAPSDRWGHTGGGRGLSTHLPHHVKNWSFSVNAFLRKNPQNLPTSERAAHMFFVKVSKKKLFLSLKNLTNVKQSSKSSRIRVKSKSSQNQVGSCSSSISWTTG